MGAVYAGLLLERSDAFCATTPHHQIVRTVCQITSSLGQLKTECFPPNQLFSSKALARREIFEYIEVYYNNQRLHSSLEYRTPRQFETVHSEKKNNFFKEKVPATPFQNA